jgi:hypothetical protein
MFAINRAAAFIVAVAAAGALVAQTINAQQSATGAQDKDKPTPEQKAALLLEQIIGEASALRLPESRIYIQVSAADMMWDRDQSRARSLFGEAAAAVADLIRRSEAASDRRSANTNRSAMQLRQELVMTIARHDPALAYQLLQTMPVTPATGPGGRNPQGNLEQALMAAIAADDPSTALKNAQEYLDKGQYPSSISKVLSELQQKDADSAAKLSEQIVHRLNTDELLAKQDAARLSLNLLRPGARPDAKPGSQPVATDQVLNEAAYRGLLGAAIGAALKATPQAAGFRGRPNNQASQPTEADIAQANARILLNGLQTLLAQVDKYQPDRAQSIRQKLTEVNGGNDPRNNFAQIGALMQQGTSDSLLRAAGSAPQGMQSRIYQQAALKALEEGSPDRARSIANDHLDSTTRDSVLHTIEIKQATSAKPNKIDDVRQTLGRAQSDDERLGLLLQFADAVQTDNPKLALQILEDARAMVTRRASNYSQLQAQIKVAHAYSALEPARSFEILEPGIQHLNELVSAAAILNGFEINVLRDGELPLQGGGGLAGMVTAFGSELASLAKIDFERAQALTDRFSQTEPRILAKLALIRGILGADPIEAGNRGFGGPGQSMRRQQ